MKYPLFTRILTGVIVFGLFLAPAGAVDAQSSQPALVGVLQPLEVAPGTLVEVPVSIENASELYAIDFELQFNSVVLTAEDADPNTPGIQAGFGQFLDAGLVLYNEIDLVKGTVRFAMSQVNPAEAKSGDGILFVIYFKAVKAGVSPLTVTNLQLASRTGLELASNAVNSTLTVAAGAVLPAATSIPVQNPTAMIQLPTPAPTAIPTATPAVTATSAVQPTADMTTGNSTDPAVQSVAIPQVQNQGEAKPFLVENWWIVLIAALAVVILGVYLRTIRKSSS